MKLNKYMLILAVLILVEIAFCIYLGVSNGGDYFCGVENECNNVQNSIYADMFGLKLSWFGVICFTILFILFLIALANRRLYWMFFLSTVIGASFAVYFIFLQIFVLRELCRDCLIIDGIAILMFIIVIFEAINFRKDIARIERQVESDIQKVYK